MRAPTFSTCSKALRQMNLVLDNVVTDITGKTGMAIIRAILAGQRAPEQLARHRDPRCKSSEEVIAKSLHGHYRDELLFCLRQAVEFYDICQQKLCTCDAAIEGRLEGFADRGNPAHLSSTAKSNRAAGALRMAAFALANSKSAP